jgi:hypothetical protein
MYLPRVLSELVGWSDHEASRYALGGVQIRRIGDKCQAEATDGRRLARVTWTDPDDNPNNCPPVPEFCTLLDAKELRSACRAVSKFVTKKEARGSIQSHPFGLNEDVNGKATIHSPFNETNQSVAVIEGRWPRTDDVVHTEPREKEVRATLNPKFLRDLADTVVAMGCEGVTVRVVNEREAVAFECVNDSGVRMDAVVMPIAADAPKPKAKKPVEEPADDLASQIQKILEANPELAEQVASLVGS